MSRKHNCPHPERSRSHYQDRLAARGVTSSSIRMDALPVLVKRQRTRIQATCTLGPNHGTHQCDGRPWKILAAE